MQVTLQSYLARIQNYERRIQLATHIQTYLHSQSHI